MSAALIQRIRPEWIDYNGHLSEGYYVVVFGFATDALMDRTGMDASYRARTGCSLYTVEAHVRYLREVGAETEVTVVTRVIGTGSRKVRLCHEMWLTDILLATEEVLALHVDQREGRAVPFPGEVADQLGVLTEPAPDYAGQAIRAG